jgi:3-oxoacyl-(acyl-carrier-protein) synthase
MRRRRVKITGIGPVTPAGIGREEFWQGLLEPVSHVRPYRKLHADHGSFVASCVDKFNVGNYLDKTLLPNGAARHTLFAVAGTYLALQDAGLPAEELAGLSGAVVVGSSLMDFAAAGSSIDSVAKYGARGAKPRTIYTFSTASIAGTINDLLGIAARTMAVQSTCCSGLDAVGYAAGMVADGEIDFAICGGTEAPLHQFPLLEIRAAGLTPSTSEMPERLNRPFDLWRTTGVVGEGASIFILEPESSPRRGYSWVSGYAFASDEPNRLCSGMTKAGRLALAEARMRPAQIEAYNAWGPGHREIDACEVRALSDIFGAALPGLPVVSIKGAVGNALGGAPAIQVAAAALSQRTGLMPPTVNWDYPDPACPLNLSNRCRSLDHGVTMISAHGVAGVNSSLILERC